MPVEYIQDKVYLKYRELLNKGWVPFIASKTDFWDVSPDLVLDLVFLPDRIEFFTERSNKMRHVVIKAEDFDGIVGDSDPFGDPEDD